MTEDVSAHIERGWCRRGACIVHLVGNLWAVDDDDHRFATIHEALAYADWLQR